jgi:endonuclease-8
MPEGDTIFRTASTLHRALAGDVVTAFDSAYPALTRVNDDQPITGRTIESVAARGKHVLMAFSGDLLLRTHMRMNGSWHIYRPGERWQRPARDMRILVATGRFVAVGFNVPEAEFLTKHDLDRHRQLSALGPDLLDPAFDANEALRRLRSCGTDPIGEALLNQRVLAGIGNVFKSEILFISRVHPHAPVAVLSDAVLQRIVDTATAQLRSNVRSRSRTLAPAPGRRTTGSLHPDRGLWVYGRAGEPCRRCGAEIALDKRGTDARLTYRCPQCQPAP